MANKHDYEAFYYRPVTAKYFRYSKALADETREVIGENLED